MLMVQNWLVGRNFQEKGSDNARKMDNAALTYMLVTYLVHPRGVPQEIVVVLAEQVFGQLGEVASG